MIATSTIIHIPGATQPVGDALPPQRRCRTPVWASRRVLRATMVITDTIMALLVAVHMVGSLKVLAGPYAFNGYAAWLRQVVYPPLPHEGPLWAARLTLGACVMVHIVAGIALQRRARSARGAFWHRALPARTIGTRSMLMTDILIGVFVLLHVLDLTIGRPIAPESFQTPTMSSGESQVSAYHNLVVSPSRPGMALFYGLVMLALPLHLAQGLWNAVIDLGGTSPRLRKACRALILSMTLTVAVANGLLPVLICTGVIG